MTLEDIKPHKSTVIIDDKTYFLQFDYAAYALLEELCGKSIYQLKDNLLQGEIGLKEQLIMLYCGLLRNHKDFNILVLKENKNIGYVVNSNLNALLEAFFKPLLPPDFTQNYVTLGKD